VTLAQLVDALGVFFPRPRQIAEDAIRLSERCKEAHLRHLGDLAGCQHVDLGIADHASLLRAQHLPSTCLLSLVVSPIAKQPGYLDQAEVEPKPSEQAQADPTRYGKRPIVFAIDDEQRCVRFFGGVCVNGANYDLFRALGSQFHAENGPEKEGHEFVTWERLTDALGISEHTLRQRILRSRRSLSRQFPRLLLVEPSQLGSHCDD
jgi:hypothetical protein